MAQFELVNEFVDVAKEDDLTKAVFGCLELLSTDALNEIFQQAELGIEVESEPDFTFHQTVDRREPDVIIEDGQNLTIMVEAKLDDDTRPKQLSDKLRPKAIVMENVEGMVNKVGDTDVRVIDWVINDLEAIGNDGEGYQVEFRLQDMTEFGIPQERERVLLVGIRDDLVESNEEVGDLLDGLTRTDSIRSIQQGLAGLPRLRRGEGGRVIAETCRGSKSRYVKENSLHEGTNLCFNHLARKHPMEKDRILFEEGLEPGDTGWDVKYNSDGKYAEYIEYDVGTADNPRFRDKYRKLQWSKPSPTIVAHLAKDSNGFVLPDYYEHGRPDARRADRKRNRGITPREAARLQSFPDDYIFLGSFTSWFRQIGNAVPPVAGMLLGEALLPMVWLSPIIPHQIRRSFR